MTVYTHVSLRQQTYEEALERLQATRARRLVTAIEHQQAVAAKHAKMNEKMSTQWQKARDQAFILINRAAETIDKAEKQLSKMQELSNAISLVED